jgi:CubicO group peptidase (beta-lactamase class C family)
MPKNILLPLFATFFVTSALAENISNSDINDAIARFESAAKQELADEDTPGLGVVVTYKGQIVYAAGIGYKESEEINPVDANTLFRLASVSKVPTAIATLQLWEKGLIDIDVPIVKYLPWFRLKDADDRWKQVTTRQLLNHTAGISREAGSDIWSNLSVLQKGYLPSSDEMLPLTAQQEIIFQPGSRLKYSNFGYWILSQIIAEYSGATGNTADERFLNYVEQNVLKPLNMSQSGYILKKTQADQLANPYGLKDNNGDRVLLPKIFDAGGSASGWGLYSSANDLGKMLIWLTSALTGHESGILKASTVKEMITDPPKDYYSSTVRHGLGLSVNGKLSKLRIGHSGSFPGYVANMMVDMNTGIGIAVILNSVQADTYTYWDLAFDTIGSALRGQTITVSPSRSAPAASLKSETPHEFQSIVGMYTNLFAPFSVESDESGNLQLQRGRDVLSMTLISKASDRIDFRLGTEGGYSGWMGEPIAFYLDASGKVSYVLVGNSNRCYRIEN